MSDDLDLRSMHQRHQPQEVFRAELRRKVEAIVSDEDRAAPAVDARDFVLIEVEPGHSPMAPRRRGRWVALVTLASAAAVIVVLALLASTDDRTAPADTRDTTTVETPSSTAPNTNVTETPSQTAPNDVVVDSSKAAEAWLGSPLAEPSLEEVAQAGAGVYRAGTGQTEVTTTGNFVSLLPCVRGAPLVGPCGGAEAWSYRVGDADTGEVQRGLLGAVDSLVLSALDDRYFVASTTGACCSSASRAEPSATSPGAPTPPQAWLIDSVTGRRGQLAWKDQPATIDDPQQLLVRYPHVSPYLIEPLEPFLPRVLDKRDWTISPLAVPENATTRVSIQQPGSGRVWIGTTLDGWAPGLAYTDDGGASWTDVLLPAAMPPTNEEVSPIAATGDEIAVITGPGDVLVSADAGETWTGAPYDPAGHNGMELFVFHDGRLIVNLTIDPYVKTVLVSTSASDWSHLVDSGVSFGHADFDVDQRGVALVHPFSGTRLPTFSKDLIDWRTIPDSDA